MRRIVRIATTVVFVLLLAAISSPSETPAAETKAIRFGVTISESAETTVGKYQPLMDYLSDKVGRPFDLQPAKSYELIRERMKAGELDGGVLGSAAGSDMIHHGEAVPLARPESRGVSTYRGHFIVRKDRGFRKVQDLKGKTFDSNAGSASVGKYFPRKLLKDRNEDFDTFFSKVTSSAKHDTALYKVLNAEADCATVKDTVFDKLAKTDPRVVNELTILATSGKFPDGNVLFRKGTSPDLLLAIRQVLLAMDRDPQAGTALKALGADRYIETGTKDFAYLNKLVKQAGLK